MASKRREHRRYALLLSLIALFNGLDYLATQDLVAFGEHGEWNPLMRGLVGTPYFAFYKLLLIPTGLMFLWLVRKWAVPKYLGLVKLACGAYGLLMIYTWVVFYA